MHSKGLTKGQKAWHDTVRGYGCVITRQPCQLHHCAGRKARHNKVVIGEWWVIGLRPDHHDNINFLHTSEGFHTRKEFEKYHFLSLVKLAESEGKEIPPPEVIEAIKEWRR